MWKQRVGGWMQQRADVRCVTSNNCIEDSLSFYVDVLWEAKRQTVDEPLIWHDLLTSWGLRLSYELDLSVSGGKGRVPGGFHILCITLLNSGSCGLPVSSDLSLIIYPEADAWLEKPFKGLWGWLSRTRILPVSRMADMTTRDRPFWSWYQASLLYKHKLFDGISVTQTDLINSVLCSLVCVYYIINTIRSMHLSCTAV